MIRILVFLLIVLALGLVFAWVADRPGEVVLQWQGMQYETSLMVALSALVALVAILMIGWWLASAVLRSPFMVRRFFTNRRRDRGYSALSGGLIAAGSGDVQNARRLAGDSRKLLGSEPLVDLLEAQTALLEGNREAAREQFRSMLEGDQTRLIALRGLHLEAERENDPEAAHHYARQAADELPGLPWASGALLRYQAAEGDWPGALGTLDTIRASGRLDKQAVNRKRAVLLTAQARAEEAKSPERAAKLAREALGLAPDLVPAAVTGATALIRQGDLKRAARMLEATWKRQSHPEIAETYVHLRTGDSAIDRLKRARKLANTNRDDVEGALALAQAAIAARNWKVARETMKPVLENAPTERACLIMAEIEEGEYGDKGRMRDWYSRALRAPRDPSWTADGVVSDKWQPISPVTGEIDAFEWKVPVERLGLADSVAGSAGELAALSQPLSDGEIDEIAETIPQPSPEMLKTTATAEVARAATMSIQKPVIAPGPEEDGSEQAAKPVAADEPTTPMEPEAAAAISSLAGDAGAGAAHEQNDDDGEITLQRLPDDPGIEPDDKTAEDDKKRFGLF